MQKTISIDTLGRSFVNITPNILAIVIDSSVKVGLCHIFIKHTSASLIICENTDPSVLTDLENYMSRLVEDGDQHFTHTTEGMDDMSAHIRSTLTQSMLSIPINKGSLVLGTWQGIYLWEHRYSAHSRQIVVTIIDSQ